MNRAKDIIRLALVSPELAFILLACLLWQNQVAFLSDLGATLKSNIDLWKYIPVLPITFTATSLKLSTKLRAPLEQQSNKELYKWPGYYKLVNRVVATVIICLLCSVLSLYVWFFMAKMDPSDVGVIFLFSSLISGISTLIIYFANHRIREILEVHGGSNK